MPFPGQRPGSRSATCPGRNEKNAGKAGRVSAFSFVRPPGGGTREGLQRAAAGAVPPLWGACGKKGSMEPVHMKRPLFYLRCYKAVL